MNRACDKIQGLLDAASTGGFDQLGTDQVAVLEAHLNACPACANRIAHQPAAMAGDDILLAGRQRVHVPSASWEQMWDQIDAASAAAGGGAGSYGWITAKPRFSLLRTWRPLAVAAACALMVGLWNLLTPSPTPAWTFQSAGGVDIDELEVFGDATPFVVSIGGDDSLPVIWVLGDQDDEGV